MTFLMNPKKQEGSYIIKSLKVFKVNALITRPYAYCRTIHVWSDHVSMYPYGHDHTRIIQILIWFGTLIPFFIDAVIYKIFITTLSQKKKKERQGGIWGISRKSSTMRRICYKTKLWQRKI